MRPLRLRAPEPPPSPHGVISPCDQLSAARAVVPPPLLCGVRAIVGSPRSCLPWRVHVVCAMNSLHPARTLLTLYLGGQLGGAWPAATRWTGNTGSLATR